MCDKINFKVFLIKENDFEHKRETRRFVMNAEDIKNISHLYEKLEAIFPIIKGKSFAISWKDCYCDDITISSYEELQIALKETNGSTLFQLYVTLHSNYKDGNFKHDSNDSNGTRVLKTKHVNVECDVCGKDICGFRYKCLQCTDYDLCSNCESKALHFQHLMIRISEPVQWQSYHGKRLSHHINKFKRKVSSFSNREGRETHFSESEKFSNIDAKNVCNLATTRIETFIKYLNDWTNISCDDESAFADKEKKRLGSAENNEDRNFLCSVNQSNTEAKKLVETISKILNTFGMDAKIELFPHEGATTSNVTSTEAQENPIITSTDSTNKLNEQRYKANSLRVNKDLNFKDYSKELDSETLNAQNWIFVDDENINSSHSDSSSNCIAKDNISASEDSTNNTNTQKVYPVQSGSSNYLQENSIIKETVQTLLEMGFSNKNDSLLKLSISKNGDINEALDRLLLRDS